MINIKDMGAIGNGIVDDTVAIQNALNNPTESVYIPEGVYKISAPLLIKRSSQILRGEGFSSRLLCSIPINAIMIKPDGNKNVPAYQQRGGRISDFYIDGQIINGIVLDVSKNDCFISNHTIENIGCNQTTGSAICMNNLVNQGGYFCSSIRNCFLLGGIKLIGAGDSLCIQGNICSGKGIGIDMTFIPGAACTDISNNNITTTKQLLRIGQSPTLLKICNNQFEKWLPNSENLPYAIELSGGFNVQFHGNNINSLGHSAVGMSVSNANSVSIDYNVINDNPSLYIRSSVRTFIGKHNNFAGNIVDQGTGTIKE